MNFGLRHRQMAKAKSAASVGKACGPALPALEIAIPVLAKAGPADPLDMPLASLAVPKAGLPKAKKFVSIAIAKAIAAAHGKK